MEKHIINCSKVDHSICEAIIYMVETREISSLNATNPKRKKYQVENEQTTLVKFYENSELSREQKDIIDTALIKAFVCCSLP